MKKLSSLILAVCAGLCISTPGAAYDTTAEQAIILDYDTGTVLYSLNAETPMTPASMTKIMTAYMVFERLADGRLQPTDTFTVSERAWREGGWASGGSTMGLAIDEEVSVIDLLHGVIVQSGNDACIVLAEGIAGSEAAFADLMSARAQELGLTTAEFHNATGLFSEGHEISAHDLARLARLTIENFPQYYDLYSVPSFEWSGIRQPNRNPLLSRFEGADGLKTGHLSISGYGLVGSAVEDGVRRIVVINGLENETERAREAERIMRAAFREFSIASLYTTGEAITNVPVWLGSETSVSARTSSEVTIAYESAARGRLTASLVLPGTVTAPVQSGQELGYLEISDGERVLGTFPIEAGEDVPRAGLFSRALEGLSQLLVPGSETSSSEESA